VTGGLTRGLSRDIHDIEVKGIKTGGLCHGMICLAANGNKVYNIKISDFDEAPEGARASTVCIYTGYGTGYTAGDIHDISVKNIHATQSRYALELRADVRDVVADGIVNDNPNGTAYHMFPNPNKRYGYRVGISTCGYPVEKTDEAYFSALRDGGICDLELSAKKDDAFKYDFGKLDELAWKYGIKLWSLHLPFMPFEEIDISKPSLAEETVKRLSELIRRAATEAGITKFVIHPSGEPIADEERRERMECAKKSLKELAAVAAEYGAVIAVENLPRTCLGRNSDEILELISVHENLRVCFDTNHLLNEDNETFISRVGDKIVTIHVSDYDFIDERHWLPGEGKVDWQKLIDALKKTGYNGPWMYEIVFKYRDRILTTHDFAENAHKLSL
jgi:sugar phosphate isomerase/epimerase